MAAVVEATKIVMPSKPRGSQGTSAPRASSLQLTPVISSVPPNHSSITSTQAFMNRSTRVTPRVPGRP